MSGVIPPQPQYAPIAWCLVKKSIGTTLLIIVVVVVVIATAAKPPYMFGNMLHGHVICHFPQRFSSNVPHTIHEHTDLGA